MAEQIIPLQAVATAQFQAPASTHETLHDGVLLHDVSLAGTSMGQPRLPHWLRTKSGKARQTVETGAQLKELNIVTVCEEARCPNIGECWSHRTATFMICGDKCTRACAFCNIATAKPGALDASEPQRVAEAAKRLGLKYVVVTSVDRDDLPDGGSNHWVQVMRAVRQSLPEAKLEVLTPDFRGKADDYHRVAAERPDVYNHNIETVPRLYNVARRGSKYERSLKLLQDVKSLDSGIKTKSGLMTGLGETKEEIVQVLHDLKAHGVDIVTMGQYLRPSPRHLAVQKYYHPDEFEELRLAGEALGFALVASGPFVRSSYHAGEDFQRAQA
jgi:lipoic acid synthetase